jgi:hypothetical protein
MEVAEVRASAELELQARLLEQAGQELERREAAAAAREAALAERERDARDAAAAARDWQQQEGSQLAHAEQQARQSQQRLQQVRGLEGCVADIDFPVLFLPLPIPRNTTQPRTPQQLDQARAEAAELASQRASLDAWQRRLEQQQRELEDLEGAAAETLGDARDAAAAALAQRDQVTH